MAENNLSEKYINNIIEPKHLFLMWKDPETRTRYKVGIVTKDKFKYLHNTFDMTKAIEAGFAGFSAFNFENTEHNNPIGVFLSRCPPKQRRDYNDYLRAFKLNPDDENVKNISSFALLGYTGAYLPDDPFNLTNPYEYENQDFEFTMQIAGSHYNYFKNHDANSAIGLKLKVCPEPQNKYDPDAIALMHNEECFGYVPKGLSKTFANWHYYNIIKEISVFRVNGSKNHPYAYAFIEIKKKDNILY